MLSRQQLVPQQRRIVENPTPHLRVQDSTASHLHVQDAPATHLRGVDNTTPLRNQCATPNNIDITNLVQTISIEPYCAANSALQTGIFKNL